MAYGSLLADVVKSSSSSPVTFQNTSGTEVGTLCRAWVNFNASSGTPVIRASFNVSSITDNGTGNFTINFTTAMPDANYSIIGTTSVYSTGAGGATVFEIFDTSGGGTDPTASAVKIYIHRSAVAAVDQAYICASIFR